jgi:hypothetical protein
MFDLLIQRSGIRKPSIKRRCGRKHNMDVCMGIPVDHYNGQHVRLVSEFLFKGGVLRDIFTNRSGWYNK